MLHAIDADAFLSTVVPAIQAGDCGDLARRVLERWRPIEVCSLLRHANPDVRRVAAVTLGMVGDRSTVPCLSKALRDDDVQVNQMAEHGLWSIWFRGGAPEANKPFREGVALLATEDYRRAVDSFEDATDIDPEFAEAYNQCAIAHFFLGQYETSILAGRRAVELIPTHFGAIAGMGHSFTEMGDLPRALRCYRRALLINPRMPGIADAILRLRTLVRHQNNESGEFLADHIVG